MWTVYRAVRTANLALTTRVLCPELLIEYSSTRLIPEVAINYRVAQNKRNGHQDSFKLLFADSY